MAIFKANTFQEGKDGILSGCVLLRIAVEVQYGMGDSLPAEGEEASHDGSDDEFFHADDFFGKVSQFRNSLNPGSCHVKKI